MENGVLKESMVVCQTTEGVAIRATLLRLTRFAAFFEIYNPTSVLRLSEVLTDFRVIIQERTLYSGRAVVHNVVHAGATIICEAGLEETAWTDVAFTPAMIANGRLGEEFAAFFREWQKLYRVSPDYKVVVADLQSFLTEVRLWLDQVELGIRSSPSADRSDLEKEVVHRLEGSVVADINRLFERFEAVAQGIDEDLQPVHRTFGKRQLHPLLLSSPFVYRTFQKPLGYAGDYEVVNMMFRDPCEGSSLFAKVVNTYSLQLPPIVAHRNRITFLITCLAAETRRVAWEHREARIFNLGCGPAQEVQRFLTTDEFCNKASFTLADFNEETLTHAEGVLTDLKKRYVRTTRIQMIKRSVQQLLKQAERVIQRPAAERYDVVCCAGLFDYLSDRVCRKLMDLFYDMLAPGGLLIATNVDVHPSRGEMEHFLEWHLIHRNTPQMAALAPHSTTPDQVSLTRDPTGVNIFMSVRKPKSER